MLVLNVEVKWINTAITLQLNHSHDCGSLPEGRCGVHLNNGDDQTDQMQPRWVPWTLSDILL